MTAEQDAADPEQTNHNSQTIVLVEDHPPIASLISSFIHAATSYQVLSFSDGQDLLHHLDDLRTRLPVLLLLDYHLPTMTGLQLYEQLQHIEGFRKIPALFITAEVSSGVKEELIQRHLGVLSKPFTFKEFLAALTPLLT